MKTVLIMSVLLVLCCACGSVPREVDGNSVDLRRLHAKVLSVVLKNGDMIVFDEQGGRYVSYEQPSGNAVYQAVVGRQANGKIAEIAPVDIAQANILRTDTGLPGHYIAGVAIGVIVLLIGVFATANWH